MVGNGGMGDICSLERRHVAFHAVVLRAPLLSTDERQRTALLLVTVQTATAVIIDSLGGRGEGMRIVTGNAAQLAFACLKTAAPVHLLDLADGPLIRELRLLGEHGPGLM